MGLPENIRADFNKRRAVNMLRLNGGDYVNYDPATCTFTAYSHTVRMDIRNQRTFEACIRKAGLVHTKAVPAHTADAWAQYHGFSWVLSLPAPAEESQQIGLI